MLHGRETPFHDYVDPKAGTVDRIIFSDQAIYEMELERIFARCWNFMCHESQIPNKGDYFLTFIGEESVIATRDKTGTLQVFINSCRHRGNAVCRAESGNARSFLCTYHGWTFGLDGKLIGVPGYKDLYHEDLKREEWGLISAAKVASFKGFVFATMDPEAPDLEDYLGEVGRLGLNLIAGRGDQAVVDGVQKFTIGCNWKLAVDNVFDFYHPDLTHASAFMARVDPTKPPPPPAYDVMSQRVALGRYGHAISGPRMTPEAFAALDPAITPLDSLFDEAWRHHPENKAEIGTAGQLSRGHPNIFPNLWIAPHASEMCLRIPRGPGRTEIWWFVLVPTNLSPEALRTRVNRANHVFGPAGMLEQEDGENWDQSTRATAGVVARRYPLNFAMNLGRGEIKRDGGVHYVDTHTNEHAQLWTWRSWADWMDAENWGALERDSTAPPMDVV